MLDFTQVQLWCNDSLEEDVVLKSHTFSDVTLGEFNISYMITYRKSQDFGY